MHKTEGKLRVQANVVHALASENSIKDKRFIAKYLKPTIDWGIRFKRSKPLKIEESQYEDLNNLKKGGFSRAKSYSIPKDPSLDHVFDIDIDAPILRCFVDASHASDLRKRRSITGVVLTFCGGAIVYK